MIRHRRSPLGLAALTVMLAAGAASAQQVRPFESPAAWEFSGSAWSFADGRLTQASVTGQPRAFYRAATYGDVDLQVRFRVADQGDGVQAAGLILRSTDSQSAFLIHYDCRNDQLIITRDGLGEERHEAGRKRGVKLDPGQWYTARTTIVGDRLTVYLDGAEQLTAQDPTLAVGRVGVYTSQGKVEFERFEVTGTTAELRGG